MQRSVVFKTQQGVLFWFLNIFRHLITLRGQTVYRPVCNWFLGNKKVNKINRIMNININLRDHVRRQFFGSQC